MDERARSLSRLYDEVTAEVKVPVDQADPEGLLEMGAPADEYDDAVAELTRRVMGTILWTVMPSSGGLTVSTVPHRQALTCSPRG
jgi:hypothetical protein